MWYTIEQRFQKFISHDQILQSIQTWCQIKANHLINLLTKFQHSPQHHPRVIIKMPRHPTTVSPPLKSKTISERFSFSGSQSSAEMPAFLPWNNAQEDYVRDDALTALTWPERERETNASRSHTLSSQIIIFHLCTFPPNQKKMFIFELVFPFSSPPKVETFSSKNSAKNFNYFARKFIKSWTIFTEIFYSFP